MITTLLSPKILLVAAETMSLPSNSKIDKLKALVENHHNPTSYVEDVNCLCQDLGNSPYHHILPEELGLLTKLYQNIYDAMVNSDKEARYVHTNAAKSIIVVLGYVLALISDNSFLLINLALTD